MDIYSEKDNKGAKICTLEDWYKYYPPKGKEKHWVDGRSAMEMARFWLKQENQEIFRRFLQEKIAGFDYECIIPEFGTPFDDYHNPRKNDLFIIGKDKQTIITVEGKVDEPFSAVFREEFEKEQKPSSNKPDRMENLYKNYFRGNDGVFDLMYQLTYWFAGTLAETERRGAGNAVMVLQEFKTSLTDKDKVAKNHADFENFIRLISEGKYGGIGETQEKEIIGPIENPYTRGRRLYIGYFPVDIT